MENFNLIVAKTVSFFPVIFDPFRSPVLTTRRLASVTVRAELARRLDHRIVQLGLHDRAVGRAKRRQEQNEEISKNSADVKCHFCRETEFNVWSLSIPAKGAAS